MTYEQIENWSYVKLGDALNNGDQRLVTALKNAITKKDIKEFINEFENVGNAQQRASFVAARSKLEPGIIKKLKPRFNQRVAFVERQAGSQQSIRDLSSEQLREKILLAGPRRDPAVYLRNTFFLSDDEAALQARRAGL